MMISHFRKIIKCQKGESNFPWFFVLIGIPVLISVFGDDDEEVKITDTTDEKKAIVEKVNETSVAVKKETQKMIDTAKKDFEKEKEQKLDNSDPFADGPDNFKFDEKLF